MEVEQHKFNRKAIKTALSGCVAPYSPPIDLQKMPCCVIWRYEIVPGETKPRKVPHYTIGGRRRGRQGSKADRAGLTVYPIARAAASRRGFDGVGFALLPEFGIVALDFDNCFDADGRLHPEVAEIVSRTYAEYSPSGKGVRAFFRGNLGNHKSPNTPTQYGFEVFSTKGFVTFTGNILPSTELLGLENTIADVDDAVRALCQKRFGADRQAIGVAGDDPFAGLEKPMGLTIDQMQALLDKLDPDMGRDDWIKIGMALHFECEGDDTGLTLFDEWSAKGGKYPSEEALKAQWESFSRPKRAGQRPITMATVMRLVKLAAPTTTSQQAATAEELEAVAADIPAGDSNAGVGTPEGFTGKFPAISAADLSRRPPPEWLIKTVIPKADVGVIFGASGSGKSFVALDMAAAIALGIPWRGHKTAKGRVLIIAAEGSGGVGKRLKAYAQHHQININELDIAVIAAAPNFLIKADIFEIVATVKAAGGFDLVITDTFAQVTPGADENAGRDMGLALSNAKALAEATGALVLLVHHTGKDTTRGARGWSGIKAAADAEIEVIKHEAGGREIRISKMKDGDDGLSWVFKLEIIKVGRDSDGDVITSCVVEPVEGVIAPALKKSGPRGRNQQLVYKAARTLGANTTEGADEQAVIDQAARSMTRVQSKRDQRQNYAVRALKALLDNKVLVLSEGRLYSPAAAPPPSEGAVH